MKEIKKEDLSFTYDCFGYMIQYKGFNIGGAGTDRKGRRSQKKLKESRENAENEVGRILQGRISGYMMENIKRIDFGRIEDKLYE